MDLFSISQLSQFSGVKAHTIRIWEQRYKALKPNRSEGNTRYYPGNQLQRLLNITSLLEVGFKISELGHLTDEELHSKLRDISSKKMDLPEELFISQMITSGMTYNEANFNKIFSHCLLRFGMKNTYTRIIYPLLERVGFLWSTNELFPSSEHFISNLILQKLYTSIDSLIYSNENHSNWLLFLPENEFHEIGLLMANYLIRSQGHNTIYLGANTPLNSIELAIKHSNPDNLLFFSVHGETGENFRNYIKMLSSQFKGNKIYACGKALNEKLPHQPKNIHLIEKIEDLEKQLETKTV